MEQRVPSDGFWLGRVSFVQKPIRGIDLAKVLDDFFNVLEDFIVKYYLN